MTTIASTAPPRILVIKSRHLGDVLLTAPLISTLKTALPDARITAAVKAECAPMLAGHPDLDGVLTFPQPRPGESESGWLRRQAAWLLALRAAGFDWSINTTEGDRGIITGFLSGAARRTGLLKSGRNRWWRGLLLTHPLAQRPGRRHAVVRNLDLLEAPPGPFPRRTRVRMHYADADLREVETHLRARGWDGSRPLIHIHPVARWLFKCWTDKGMADVIDHLGAKGFAVGITSSPDPAELRKVAGILALCRTRPLDLSGVLSLKQAAAFTSMCRLFFGVDTAMMHMAASQDVPVVALFGPTMAFEWGPWPNDWDGAGGTPYPQANGVQSCGPHTVVQKDWPCVPCGRDGCAGSKISDCLQRLESPEVIPLLDHRLL